MKLPIQRTLTNSQSGFSLVEVLIAAVIFAGVFLLLFTLLGRVLSNSSSADALHAASIADICLGRFHASCDLPKDTEVFVLDGVRFRVLAATEVEEQRVVVRLTICRENTGDTLATVHGIRYAPTD